MSPGKNSNHLRNVLITSFIGTAIEWYDYFIYGTAAALVFNQLFFPTFDPLAGTMAAFATFAVGFVARPVGAIVCGHFGDVLGRKSMLVATLMVMGLATFAIGLLPTYESVGVWAPVGLVVLRFIQGLGVGGEWGGAVLMSVEHGCRQKRGFYGSCTQIGAPAGLLLANIVFALCALLPTSEFLQWGWRIPFLSGIALTAVGLFIRLHVQESPLFEAEQAAAPIAQRSEPPILQLLRSDRRSILLTIGARVGENICFYIFTVFVLTYADGQSEAAGRAALYGVMASALLSLMTIPLFAALSDRIGRRPVYIGGAIFVMAFSYPAFLLIDSGRSELIMLSIAIGMAIGHAAMYGPQAAFFSELFGTGVRYSGISLGFQLASPFAGGLAPLVATALLSWSDNNPWPVAVYLSAAAALTAISVWWAPETYNADLAGSGPEAGMANSQSTYLESGGKALVSLPAS